ncbi:major facilitator superfamily domain-containing protein [Chytriomyces sp. MP71]|nr:major facilitator superfamily domain-containing protein [Chytriomyces sp. MP71]
MSVSLFKLNRIFDVIALAVAFCCVFMAFGVTQSMASTVLPSSVAFPALGILYTSYALFNLFLSAPLVDRIGPRLAMLLATLTYTLFEAADVIALLQGEGAVARQMAVLFPASVLIGAGAGVLWTAQGMYVLRCGSRETIGRYTGVFFGIMNVSNCLGPLFTALLLQASMERVTAFGILTGVGALGPLLLVYILVRPEPGNPATMIVVNEEEDKTPRLLRTSKLIFSRNMLLLIPLYLLHGWEGSFNGSSLPLFIKTDSPSDDLRQKLYLSAASGAASFVASFAVGPFTDLVGNPFMIISVDMVLHMAAMLSLWLAPNAVNNLSLLYPVSIILAVSDSILLNQTYKLIGGLFPANSTAYAAYKFHWALGVGICLFVSKVLLGTDKVPLMYLWTPIVGVLFVSGLVGVWIVSRDIKWKEEGASEGQHDDFDATAVTKKHEPTDTN